MFCKFLLSALLTLGATACVATPVLEFDYRYGGEHGVDFSTMPRGPLKVGEFSDSRPAGEQKALGEVAQLPRPIAELVREALVKGIRAGKGELVNEKQKLLLSGEISEVKAVEENGEIEVTIRSRAKLHNSNTGSELFKATLFGRAAVPKEQGAEAALSASLDQLVNSLLWDDYFLMQVID